MPIQRQNRWQVQCDGQAGKCTSQLTDDSEMISDVNVALWDEGWAIEGQDKYYCPRCQHRRKARKASAMPQEAFVTLANIPVNPNASLEEQIQEAFDWIRDNFSEVVFWRHVGELEEPLDVATYCQEWNSEEQ